MAILAENDAQLLPSVEASMSSRTCRRAVMKKEAQRLTRFPEFRSRGLDLLRFDSTRPAT